MADHVDTGTPPSQPNIELFRAIAENIREIFWVIDPTTKRVLYLNHAYEYVTGRSVEAVLADPTTWRQALHPTDRVRFQEELERRTLSGEPHDLECRIVRPDGEVRWLWMRGLPVVAGGGLLAVGVAEDITERKRAEERLERSLSLLNATLQATADGILALDREGRITTFNDRFMELWGIPESVAAEAKHEDDLWKHVRRQLRSPELLSDRLRRLGSEPQTESLDTLNLTDGRIIDAHSRPRRLGRELDGRVWSFRDMTARLRAERELRERTRRLALFNDVLLDLARTPVADRADRKVALERIADTAADMLETDRVGIWLYDRNRRSIHEIELFDRRNGVHRSGERIRQEDAPSYFAALPEERALALHDVRTDARTAELAESYCIPHGIASMLDAPIRAAGEVVGIVCFEHRGEPRHWTVEEESFAGSIADLVAITLEAANRRRAEWSMRFLASASASLASSLDYHTTIDNVVQLAVPTLATWCLVDIIEGGEIRRVASRHEDPAKATLLQELAQRYPPDWSSVHPAGRALHTGAPDLVQDVDSKLLSERTHDDGHRRLIEQLGIRSYMAVPLRTRDRVLGVITFVCRSRNLDQMDLSLALDLATRAAVAIDNATLFASAQESSHAKSNFLAVMSHELRTPLTAISGYTDLMLEGISGPLSPRQQEQLERIKLRTTDLVRIIEEILAFAKMEDGGEQFGLTTLDLSELVRRVADTTRPLVEESGLAFEVNVPDEPMMIQTNARRLEHVLLNLLSNAIRFTSEGTVRLDARLADGSALIRISDTGIGIEERNRERIFEPFYQVEEATTREKGGTGLGLAIARRFARLLGGDIMLESEPGRGSTFTVELPVGELGRRPATDRDTRRSDPSGRLH